MGADADTLNQWSPAPALIEEWVAWTLPGGQRWTSKCGRVVVDVAPVSSTTDWTFDARLSGTRSPWVIATVSEGAAKRLGIDAAQKLLAELDKPAPPSFTKADTDKPRTDLLPPHALLEVSRVLGHGAAKYGHDNHLRAGEYVESRYIGAALRHLFAHMGGEANDTESGLAHLAHAAASLLLVIERGAAACERGGK